MEQTLYTLFTWFILSSPYLFIIAFSIVLFYSMHPTHIYSKRLLQYHYPLVELQYEVMRLAHYYGANETFDYDACVYYLTVLPSFPDRDLFLKWVANIQHLEDQLAEELEHTYILPGLKRRVHQLVEEQTYLIQCRLYQTHHQQVSI